MRDELADALVGYEPRERTDPNLQDSAVVLSIVDRGPPLVTFVRRAADRPRHAGEIGLPGGRTEPIDGSLRETAIREFEEEVGVAPERLDLLGRLDDVATPTGYRIAPFVGIVDPDATFERQEAEVDELLFVPLSKLIEQHDGEDDPAYEYDGTMIWGATGRIVASFLTIVEG